MDNFISPREQLPKKGQRVKVMCIKEMTFLGDDDMESSQWLDDGEGERGIMFWSELNEEN